MRGRLDWGFEAGIAGWGGDLRLLRDGGGDEGVVDWEENTDWRRVLRRAVLFDSVSWVVMLSMKDCH